MNNSISVSFQLSRKCSGVKKTMRTTFDDYHNFEFMTTVGYSDYTHWICIDINTRWIKGGALYSPNHDFITIGMSYQLFPTSSHRYWRFYVFKTKSECEDFIREFIVDRYEPVIYNNNDVAYWDVFKSRLEKETNA